MVSMRRRWAGRRSGARQGRALLAQAESTTFEAEAESFTAKAQQLMARHAIDAAMVGRGPGGSTAQ